MEIIETKNKSLEDERDDLLEKNISLEKQLA